MDHLESTALKLEKENNILLDKVDQMEYEREKQFRSIENRNDDKIKQL